MSGFFAGPPLITHVIVVAPAVAVTIPILSGYDLSRTQLLLVALGLLVAYAILAIAWGSRHVIFDHPGRQTPPVAN